MSIRDQAIHTALIGDWKNAVTLNKELLEEDPKDIDALNRLALALQVLGKTRSAKMSYQKVLKLDPLNPIALRNIRNLKTSKKSGGLSLTDIQLSNNFIEETGKTKVVELVNIAPASLVQHLRTGEKVALSIKRLRIFVLKGEKQYLGVLPDDIGRRLIRFMKAGNRYEAYVKSSNPKKILVFIKETKKVTRFKNQPSFQTLSESKLFDKERIKDFKTRSELEDDESVEEEV